MDDTTPGFASHVQEALATFKRIEAVLVQDPKVRDDRGIDAISAIRDAAAVASTPEDIDAVLGMIDRALIRYGAVLDATRGNDMDLLAARVDLLSVTMHGMELRGRLKRQAQES
jgi:hypothetical protein